MQAHVHPLLYTGAWVAQPGPNWLPHRVVHDYMANGLTHPVG
jgi:hypothetical protein